MLLILWVKGRKSNVMSAIRLMLYSVVSNFKLNKSHSFVRTMVSDFPLHHNLVQVAYSDSTDYAYKNTYTNQCESHTQILATTHTGILIQNTHTRRIHTSTTVDTALYVLWYSIFHFVIT